MKQLLGHSKLSTTQKSMHELQSDQREAMTKIENPIWFPRWKTRNWRRSHKTTKFAAQCGPVATVASR
jgi:uncharacterized membrane protein (DUF106 family)